jgi:hypothetical protein
LCDLGQIAWENWHRSLRFGRPDAFSQKKKKTVKGRRLSNDYADYNRLRAEAAELNGLVTSLF